MERFKDLPDGVIGKISLHLDITDFWHFVLVDKRVHSICGPLLSEFQALHQKWSSINLSTQWDLVLVNLLIEILKEPESVRFIRECHSDVGYGIQQSIRLEKKVHLDTLRRILSVTPLIDPESKTMWMEALDKIDATPIDRILYPPYTLIWSFLPDLHTVEITTDAQRNIAWLRQSPLNSKLKKVYFSGSTSNIPASEDDLTEILRMPSLRELDAATIMIRGPPIMSEFHHVRDAPCPLERLSIKSTVLTPERLYDIMDRIQSGPPPYGLQAFTYTHDQSRIGTVYTEFEGRAFIDVLLAFTKDSLVELDLAIIDGPLVPWPFLIWSNPYCAKWTNISLGRGLQSFQNLQSLTVAAEMLVEGWRMREVRDFDQGGRLKIRYVDVVDSLAEQICLGEILPLSLRELKITSSESNGESRKVLIEKLLVLLEYWYYKVPFLRVLTLGWWPPEERFRWDLLVLCDRLGVQLEYDLVSN